MPAAHKLAAPALIVVLAIFVGASTGKIFTDSDTGHYLALAAGQSVPEPFAARQLGPLLVRGLTHLGLSLHHGFWLLGVLSLTFFVGTVAFLLEQANAARWLRWSILGLSFWSLQFAGMVLPDLFYAALVSAFLLLVSARHYSWASLTLLPLMVARESTVLLLLCWLYVAWKTLTLRSRLISIASTVVGAMIVRWLARGSGGNREGIPPLFYLLGKVPWNFAKNVLGVEPWVNLNPSCGIPVWHHALHLGALRDIGYCSPQPEYPIRLLAYALGTFGLLPLLLWHLRREPTQNLLTRFCLLYGVLAFATAGLLGYSVQRLYGYGWPAFLVALPLLARGGGFRTERWAAAFVSLHLLGTWLEWRIDKGALLLAELLVWVPGIWLLSRGWKNRAQTSPETIGIAL